jgi:hypothetical protein
MSLEDARQRHKQTGRNDDCPCGSGKKYKKCHQAEDDAVISKELTRLEQEAAAELAAKAAEAAEQGESEGKVDGKGEDARKKPGQRGNAPQRGLRPSAGGKANNLPRRGAV